METNKIKLAQIKPPAWYIRKRINQQHFEDLLSVAKDSPKWPFPPIVVSVLSKEEKENLSKSKKTSVFAFEALDGWHRINVATTLKKDSINAIVDQAKTQKERFLKQYETNAHQGLRLDKDMRDEAIRHMHKSLKMTENAIAKETGLTQQSINRIIRNRQRGEKAKAEREAQRKEYTESPAEIFNRIHLSAANFIELSTDMKEFLNKSVKDGSLPVRVLTTSRKNLLTILDILQELLELSAESEG